MSDAVSSATVIDTLSSEKNRYSVLDGLRGVAAVMVVIYHLVQASSYDDKTKLIVGHGYLAVDFFFLLSGFVISYAYDDRWGGMTAWAFYKRRLIRLQPMVILGSLLGAALFYLQKSPIFPLVASTPHWKMLLAALAGSALVPLPMTLDIRGGGDMYPLNGPEWSLFYECVANVLYAIGFRKLSNRALSATVLLAAGLLIFVAVFRPTDGLVGGFSITLHQIRIGLARILFPFSAGVLLRRLDIRVRLKGAFGLCSLLLVSALSLPRLGGAHNLWINGMYEALCVIVLFPTIVAIGAGKKSASDLSVRIARFFGSLSYPLYMTHFPLIYIYTAWIVRNNASPAHRVVSGAIVLIASIATAYASLRLYDEPIRRWLGRWINE